MSSTCRATSWRKCRPAPDEGIPPYFYNLDTGESVWRPPDECTVLEQDIPDFTSEDAERALECSSSSGSKSSEGTGDETPIVQETSQEVAQIVESFAPLPSEITEHSSHPACMQEEPASDAGILSRRSNTLPGHSSRDEDVASWSDSSLAPELGRWGSISPRTKNRSCIGDPDVIEAADQWTKQSTSSRGSVAGEPFFYNEVTGETCWDRPCTEAFEGVPEIECDSQLFAMDVESAVSALGFSVNSSPGNISRLKDHCDVYDIYERAFTLAKLIEGIGSDEEWLQVASHNKFALLKNIESLFQPESPPTLLVTAAQEVCLLSSLDFSLFEEFLRLRKGNLCEFLACATYGLACVLNDRNRVGGVSLFPARVPGDAVLAKRVLTLPHRCETALLSWAKFIEFLMTYLQQRSETPLSLNASVALGVPGESANEWFWLRLIGVWMELFGTLPHKTGLIGAVIQPTILLFEWLRDCQKMCSTADLVLRESLKDSRWDYIGRAILYYVNEGLKETRAQDDPLELHAELINATKVLRLILQLPFDSPVLFSSDLNVLIDILLRDLENLPETSKLRIDLLRLLGDVISSSQWMNVCRYRLEDIHSILRRFVDVAEGALEYPEEIRHTAEAIFEENMDVLKE
eukprot:gb/GECG01013838.1/.p1 GENE.gb/GECG01013838.1/~~gb/GECG01013838.1/.p1  ORF type:complete len:634 (+),score=78.02 gb/GECG01013838.1/:1-1902(+)